MFLNLTKYVRELFVKTMYNTLEGLPNDTLSALSKLKTFADDKLNINPNIRFVFPRLENIF